MAPSTLEALCSYIWPGAVLQISNITETLSATAPHKPSKTLKEVEREYITVVREATGWKIEGPDEAAKILGLQPSTLRTRMRKLGIQDRRPDCYHGRGEGAAV